MNYCGIDLAGVSSDAYVSDEKRKKLWARSIPTACAGFELLVEKFSRDSLAIAIEAGNQTAWVYETLVELGAQVTVVNPAKVKLIAESRKTDKVDAKILCEPLRLAGRIRCTCLAAGLRRCAACSRRGGTAGRVGADRAPGGDRRHGRVVKLHDHNILQPVHESLHGRHSCQRENKSSPTKRCRSS